MLMVLGLVEYWLALVGWTVWRLTRPMRRTAGVAISQGRAADPSRMSPARRFSSWTFKHRGVELPVWDIEGDDPQGPVIIFTHGWGDSRIGALSRVGALAPLASRCIAWDMPGHGDAGGTCTLGIREPESLAALIEQAVGRGEDPHGTLTGVILYGWSMGAGISIACAAREQRGVGVIGVIAEAVSRDGLTPARAVLAQQGLPHRFTLGAALACIGVDAGGMASGLVLARERDGRFDRLVLAEEVAKRGVPILLLHGDADGVCPIDDARAIEMAGVARLQTMHGAGHFGIWTDPTFATKAGEACRAWIGSLAALPERQQVK